MSDQAWREFNEGLAAIERKMKSLIDTNAGAADANLVWNYGKEVGLDSSSIELTAELDGMTVDIKFSREQVEDSWDGVVDAVTKAMLQEGARRIKRI